MSLYTDAQKFVLDSDNEINVYEAHGQDDFNTPGTYSCIFGYKATIFQPNRIILRYPDSSISEIQVENSWISFPFTKGISEPKWVCEYTASVYYGLTKKQLYITGAQAQRLFNMVARVYMNKNWRFFTKQDAEYAKAHYKRMYELMSANQCVNGVQYNDRVNTVKSITDELFNLVATYIINCDKYEKEKATRFNCRQGETMFYCDESSDTGHEKTTDPYMHKKFGTWNFGTKSGWERYSETNNPYIFAGLAHKFIELADHVHNGGKNYVLSPYTVRYLQERSLIK